MRGKGFLVSEEHGGEWFPDLGAAQRVALGGLAVELAKVLHELVTEGNLVDVGDHLVVAPEEVKGE